MPQKPTDATSDVVGIVGRCMSAILSAITRIYDTLRRIEERLERLENAPVVEGERQPTGLTDRLTLTEEQYALLREQLQKKDVSDFKIVTSFETFKRELRDEMKMYAPLTARLWNWIKGGFGE